MSSIVARRYAKALLELGREAGTIDAMVENLSSLAKTYTESPELRASMENPLVPYVAKKAILAEISDTMGLDPSTRNALFLLNDRRRVRLLPAIAARLRELNDGRKGVVRAEVTTAVRLTETYYTKLQVQLEKMTGKRVVLDLKEDPTILGGVVARIGDTVIDGSIRARLQEMKNSLVHKASQSH
ncbi:MAG: ATP synthase F1 subunit delta [Polyangiaceae bacterium]|nr:ATP synthase F1 subunit delta [Polyangiaceae bacterium]